MPETACATLNALTILARQASDLGLHRHPASVQQTYALVCASADCTDCGGVVTSLSEKFYKVLFILICLGGCLGLAGALGLSTFVCFEILNRTSYPGRRIHPNEARRIQEAQRQLEEANDALKEAERQRLLVKAQALEVERQQRRPSLAREEEEEPEQEQPTVTAGTVSSVAGRCTRPHAPPRDPMRPHR
eukprot:2841272-Prymnesium_polylepis.1